MVEAISDNGMAGQLSWFTHSDEEIYVTSVANGPYVLASFYGERADRLRRVSAFLVAEPQHGLYTEKAETKTGQVERGSDLSF